MVDLSQNLAKLSLCYLISIAQPRRPLPIGFWVSRGSVRAVTGQTSHKKAGNVAEEVLGSCRGRTDVDRDPGCLTSFQHLPKACLESAANARKDHLMDPGARPVPGLLV